MMEFSVRDKYVSCWESQGGDKFTGTNLSLLHIDYNFVPRLFHFWPTLFSSICAPQSPSKIKFVLLFLHCRQICSKVSNVFMYSLKLRFVEGK